MTELDWLQGSDHEAMLNWVGRTSWYRLLARVPLIRSPGTAGRLQRKLRLLACACWQSANHGLPLRPGEPMEVVSRFADGQASLAELSAARRAVVVEIGRYTSGVLPLDLHIAAVVTERTLDSQALGEALRSPFWRLGWRNGPTPCDLLRELFGNPFRPVAIDPGVLTWNNGTVPQLAEVIYQENRFSELPILADALEEAGCCCPELLDHCRSTGNHVRGCWAIDLLRGQK
jgi:hypothetical protein